MPEAITMPNVKGVIDSHAHIDFDHYLGNDRNQYAHGYQ